MQSSSRHLMLIIGSVLTIFGVLIFFFLSEERQILLLGGFLFIAGALLISRAIKNPQERRNRLPEIRKRYKTDRSSYQKTNKDEIH